MLHSEIPGREHLAGPLYYPIACLIWIWSRKESTQSTGAAAVLLFVLDLACYKGVIVAAVAQFLRLASWATLLQNVGLTSCLGVVTLQIYIGVTNANEKY